MSVERQNKEDKITRREAITVLAGDGDPRALRVMVIDIFKAQGKRRGKQSRKQGRED